MKLLPITVRLDEAIIRRAQKLIPVLSTPWRHATLADVYRALIITGLEELEKQKRMHQSPLLRVHPALRAASPR